MSNRKNCDIRHTLNMNTTEKDEIRELNEVELEQMTGGLHCASGQHIKTATLVTGNPRTPVAYFGGYPIF